jgi:hypothetical protein
MSLIPADLPIHGDIRPMVEQGLSLVGVAVVDATYVAEEGRVHLLRLGEGASELWLITDIGFVKMTVTIGDRVVRSARVDVTLWSDVIGFELAGEVSENGRGSESQLRLHVRTSSPAFDQSEEGTKNESGIASVQPFAGALLKRMRPPSPSV